jgi:hypothetical protein
MKSSDFLTQISAALVRIDADFLRRWTLRNARFCRHPCLRGDEGNVSTL